jgi:hypothetical protein
MKILPAFCFAVLATLLFAAPAPSQEVQRHGLVFENWIGDTFFDGHRPEYTEKWDFPGEINAARGGHPVNPKAIKYGTSVDMGDALRQFDIDEPFWLVIGYWEQRGEQKKFVHIFAELLTPEAWQKLWSPITRADLERLDAVIKDRDLSYQEARAQAHAIKNQPPFSEAIMVVHPKIDSRTQRRLQCSLRFRDVFAHLTSRPPDKSEAPELWGVPFVEKIHSPPRQFAGQNEVSEEEDE